MSAASKAARERNAWIFGGLAAAIGAGVLYYVFKPAAATTTATTGSSTTPPATATATSVAPSALSSSAATVANVIAPVNGAIVSGG